MIINPPPPIPADCAFTTPTHRAVAMAASTAFPFWSRKILTPYSEHVLESADTAACLNSRGCEKCGRDGGRDLKEVVCICLEFKTKTLIRIAVKLNSHSVRTILTLFSRPQII